MKGYCSPGDVQSVLGRTFSPPQTAAAIGAITAAEGRIDHDTRRAWLVGTPIVGEGYDLLEDWLTLRQTPVASIQSVTVRTRQVGDPGQLLQAGVAYELQDPARGLLIFTAGYGDPGTRVADAFSDGYNSVYGQAPLATRTGTSVISKTYALISYTPQSVPPPPDISHATARLAAHWLLLQFRPASAGMDEQSIQGGPKAVYSQDGLYGPIPEDVQRVIDSYTRTPIFA